MNVFERAADRLFCDAVATLIRFASNCANSRPALPVRSLDAMKAGDYRINTM